MNGAPTLTRENLQLSDDELGKLFLGFVVAAVAHARGVAFGEVTESYFAQIVVKLEEAEATDSRYSTVEKAIHKAVAGDFAIAGRLIREYMLDLGLNEIVLDEAMTRKYWRRGISRSDRGDPLTKLIRQFVEDARGDISESELMIKLKDDGTGVIDEITNDEIWYRSANGTGLSTQISNLRGRLSRAKTKYKEKSSR